MFLSKIIQKEGKNLIYCMAVLPPWGCGNCDTMNKNYIQKTSPM